MSKLVKTEIDKEIEQLIATSDHKVLVIWATDCAKRVLKYFEDVYLEDKRPRMAIESGIAWTEGKINMQEARKAAFASHAAARDAEKISSACAAARSAGHSAATVHVPSHAIYASIYAAIAIRDDKDSVEENVVVERKWQYNHLKELINEYVRK